MRRKDQIEICKRCQHIKFNPKLGLICGLTDSIQTFDNKCNNFKAFVKDEFDPIENHQKRRIKTGVFIPDEYLHSTTKINSLEDNNDIKKKTIKEAEAEIVYIEPRFIILRKFRKILKYSSIILLMVASFMLTPYFSSSTPEMKAAELSEIQPVVTYKIIFLAIVTGVLATLINAANSKRTDGVMKLAEKKFKIKTNNSNFDINFENISYLKLSHVSGIKPETVIYRIKFKIKGLKNIKQIIHIKDTSKRGKEIIEFLKSTEELIVKQEIE